MDFIVAIFLYLCSTIVDLIHKDRLRISFMTVDEIKNHFGVRFDKDLKSIFGLSTSTISNWRRNGISMLWQEAIQLRSNNVLVARIEDSNVKKGVCHEF